MLGINLATRVYVDNRKVSICIWLSGAICALFLIGNIWLTASGYQEFRQIATSIAAGLDNLRQGNRQISEKEFQQLQERIRFANGILQRKKQNWLFMLDRLEQVVPDGVMLTSIEPDKKTNALKISGVALDFKRVRTLYESLGSGTLFKDVFLETQSRVRVTEQQQGVTFSLTATVVQ